MKRTQLMKRAIMIAAAGTLVFGDTVPAIAAPVLSGTATVKMAAPDMLDQVRIRRGRGPAIGAGVVLGVIGAMGGAAAARNRYYYSPGYYDPGYYGGPVYYGSPYYGYGYDGGYAYDPVPGIALGVIGAAAGAMAGAPYVVPGVQRGRCWVETDRDRAFGYWGRCR